MIEIPNIIKLSCGKNEIGRELCDGSSIDEWSLFEEGDWTQDGKYQYARLIYFNSKYNSYYALDISRSGSQFTDWHYDYEDMKEIELYKVVPFERTIKDWKVYAN